MTPVAACGKDGTVSGLSVVLVARVNAGIDTDTDTETGAVAHALDDERSRVNVTLVPKPASTTKAPAGVVLDAPLQISEIDTLEILFAAPNPLSSPVTPVRIALVALVAAILSAFDVVADLMAFESVGAVAAFVEVCSAEMAAAATVLLYIP